MYDTVNQAIYLDQEQHQMNVGKGMGPIAIVQKKPNKRASSEYQFIVWNVAKYKSLMRGVSEGFYDTPTVLDDEQCFD